ncbi:beta-N-acetylhexosaminidase [Acholeplasma hippikon]|uniref:N-acetyl-beta-hexosaminidase n=1 Tax=Acholeplasma hippikon TaxID=264636 RepID=A0A449BIW8_9MOLU|nr:beta-N-acetylhexosaminidase [Acholeplasma hippikon]VEU82411.1 N-acetyl-beta-hexosaminidase [Acholeplasma hippikon]
MEKLLEKLNIKHQVTKFIESNETVLEGHTLYYKNIPSALYLLNHYNHHGTIVKDDGFKVKGTMIDLSRNAVFKLTYFKSVILRQALLGYNEIWLYMEDIYELEDYKKFGYLRGKYSLKDIRELDQYASELGVTLVPCIQTLGHMGQFLKWPGSGKYRDQSDVLIISDDTYKFIEAMITFCKSAFKTPKIHVGMDETFGFALGRYYKVNGYKNPEDLFLNHLQNVYNIAKKMGYGEVCIWSDMFFRHRSKANYYYDLEIQFEDDFINRIPKDITLVYWDYYSKDENIYRGMIQNHQKMNRKVIMASGTWIWTKLFYDQNKTLSTATHAIKMSQENNVQEIIFTQWNDDGAYCDYESSFLGLFDVNQVIDESINENYLEKIKCKSYSVLKTASNINALGYEPVLLLWDDLLLGIYLNNHVGYDYHLLTPMLENTIEFIKEAEKTNYNHLICIAKLLKNKLALRKILLEGYFETKNFDGAKEELNEMRKNLIDVVESFEKNWNERNKMFGLEVIQNRLFSQLRRIDTYESLVNNYHFDEKLEFLEEKLEKDPWNNVKFIDVALSSKQ